MSVEMYRCLACGWEISAEDAAEQGLNNCGSCGHTGVPATSNEDVTVSVNWQELRVLTIWAERWASEHCGDNPGHLQTVRRTAANLEFQHLNLAEKRPLTFLGEVEQLRQLGLGKITQTVVKEDTEFLIPEED